MDRREFLKMAMAAGLGLALVGQTKQPARDVWAKDGDDLAELRERLDPGGTLYVHDVDVTISRPIAFDRTYRLDAVNSTFRFRASPTEPIVRLGGWHVSGERHRIIGCSLVNVNPDYRYLRLV